MQTFSLKYDDPAIDESHYASMVLEKTETCCRIFSSHLAALCWKTIRKTTWHHDAPCPSRGRYAAWHLMQETARYSHVILTGEGGDEILAGYGRFILDAMMDRSPNRHPGLQIKKELDDLTAVTGESISHLVTHGGGSKTFYLYIARCGCTDTRCKKSLSEKENVRFRISVSQRQIE